MTQKIYPRSPYQRLGGYVHLPRFIDKARLHRCGLLHGYNYKTSGFDQHLLSFLGIDGDEFERMASELSSDEAMLAWIRTKAKIHTPAEIEAWNAAMINREPETPERISLFKRLLAKAGGAGRSFQVRTYFDLIELEEGRFMVGSRSRATGVEAIRER
ncbi:MAG: DUF5069 domain-containing protein [Verrucomicrobia bacterium]|nr:DUF5069 domain-containing protein [Verrucomicrobiota bacterium]